MFYSFSISTPKDTTESNKQETILKLTRGIVHQVDILFPPGPAGLLHLHINAALHQVWPFNVIDNFATDNEKITFREHFEITGAPHELRAYTWNEDDTYPHKVIVRIGILKRQNILRRLF